MHCRSQIFCCKVNYFVDFLMYWFIVAMNPTTISLNAKNYEEPNFVWMHYTEFLQLSVGVHRSLFKA